MSEGGEVPQEAGDQAPPADDEPIPTIKDNQ
jgi:hypothetical protein